MSSKNKHLFVSVGTTKFDNLITKLSSKECLNYLCSVGFQSITFQTGSGRKLPSSSNPGIIVKHKPFFDQFSEEVRKADLVICHAGAGTCIEVLRLHAPLIVVINECLMDNHQTELAEALEAKSHLLYSTVDTLLNTLQKMQNMDIVIYPKANENAFCKYTDIVMGFQ